MFKSIRWKFLSWLSLILLVVIGGFGATLFGLVRHSKLKEIDAELEGAAHVLAERMRGRGPRRLPRLPGGMFRRDLRGPDDDTMGRERFLRPGPGRRGPPGGFGRYEFTAERLEIPKSLLSRFGAEEDGGGPYFAIWLRDGQLLKESNKPDGLLPPDSPGGDGDSCFRLNGSRREVVLKGPRGSLLVVGVSIEKELAELTRLMGTICATGIAVLAIGLLGGWFIAKRAIRPIETISATARSISASNLSQRIDVESTESELGNLGQILNETFDRLQEAFEQQARFTADASHELRTPVSVMLAQTAMARRRERSPDEYREAIDACYVVAKRMKSLVDGLLTLAHTDSGDLALSLSDVDLKNLVEDCVGLLESLAAERGVAIQCELRPVTVEGDYERIVQVVSNLVTNAIRYNRQGGKVELKLEDAGSEARISVSDSGVGISENNVPHVFDRFYRVDASRSAQRGGTGLGLAIAKAIVEAHGGTVRCESELERGSTFSVRLPKKARRRPRATSGES